MYFYSFFSWWKLTFLFVTFLLVVIVVVAMCVCSIVKLEGELKVVSEKAAQLLIEKEKALADLNTIRKANRSMEK